MRLLLDDTNLNADQHRIKIVDSAACDCGEDMEINNHFVMECVLYAPERNIMISNIQKMWEDSRSAGTQPINNSGGVVGVMPSFWFSEENHHWYQR